MGLNKTKLQTDIENLLTALAGYDGQGTKSQTQAVHKFAVDLSAAIDAFVRSGVVQTTVTGTCPQGAVTGSGKGGIS